MHIGSYKIKLLDWMLIFVPITIGLELAHSNDVLLFLSACGAIIPLAGWMGRATEHLSARVGPGLGGLLNATFGNAAELIIAIAALRHGYYEVVKASITGSIIGNILLVLGLSLLLGGMKFQRQRFNATAAGLGATMLFLSAVGLILPSATAALHPDLPHERIELMSVLICGVLMLSYVLSLLFSLKTHSYLYGGTEGAHELDEHVWSKTRSFITLFIATALVAVVAEMLVGAIEHTAEIWGMTEVFVGVILVAVIGNAAEHSTAVLMAIKNKMDLALHIAVGSSIQIALFVAPVLVFLSYILGPQHMGLDFTNMEVLGVVLSVIVVALVSMDGESHWMEGVLLLAVYACLGVAFYLLPAP